MLADALRLGGVPMWLLLALSLAAATIVLVKLWEFRDWRLHRRQFVAPALEAWRQRRGEQALLRLRSEPGPLAAVLAAAIAALDEAGVGAEAARERAAQAATAQLERIASGLRSLETIAQLAPLLGLFGTVLGMIEAFRAVQAGGGAVEPAALAGGIWQALLTTAAGLGVALPVLAAVHAFDRVVEAQRLAMEAALTALFTQPLRPDGARSAAAPAPGARTLAADPVA